MLRIALTELRRNQKLGQCDPFSFMGAVVQAAQLGLEPGSALGHCYLIPYGSEVTLITGYKGLIELARRSGKVRKVTARLVREGDEFEEIQGTREELHHRPGKTRGQVTHAYAVAFFADGTTQHEVMDVDQIEEIRRLAKRPNPVWETHWDEMARKTAVRRLCKYLPQSPELARANELDDMAYEDKRQSLHAIIDPSHVLRSAEATTIGAVIESDNAKQRADGRAKLQETVMGMIIAATTDGVDELELCKKLGIKGLDDLQSKDERQLLAMYQILKSEG